MVVWISNLDGSFAYHQRAHVGPVADGRIEPADGRDSLPDLVFELDGGGYSTLYGRDDGYFTGGHVYTVPFADESAETWITNGKWYTSAALTNIEAWFGARIEVQAYEVNGDPIGTPVPLTLGPRASISLDAADYLGEEDEGSLELRSDARLVGEVRYLLTDGNGDPEYRTQEERCSVPLEQVAGMDDLAAPWMLTADWYVGQSFGTYASRGFYSVKNPNDEEVTVTATFYRPSGALITSVNHAIAAHAVAHVGVWPYVFPDGMGNITFTYEAKYGLVGSVVQTYKKNSTNRVVMQGDGLQRTSDASGCLSVPHYYTASGGGQDWEIWYILKNPSASQVNVGVAYYDLDGDEIYPTPVPTLAIPAHGNAVGGLAAGQMQPAEGSIKFRAQNDAKVLGRFEIIGKDDDATYASVAIGSDKLQPDEGAALLRYPNVRL